MKIGGVVTTDDVATMADEEGVGAIDDDGGTKENEML